MCDEEPNSTPQYAEVQSEQVVIKCEKVPTKKFKTVVQKPPPSLSPHELRIRRQRFILKWSAEFPWLRPSPNDDSVGYCSTCRRDLVCKKTHLERHQKTFKHMRLQGFENVYTINEPEADLIEAHTSGYLDNEYEDEMLLDDESFGYTTIKVEPVKVSPTHDIMPTKLKKPAVKRQKIENEKSTPISYSTTHQKVERDSSFTSTPRSADRSMNDFYYMPRQPPKDSFDLFFESAAASVKSLPPKLAAELKSRVSQLLSEFELRAICEKEAQEKAAAAGPQQHVTTISTPVAVTVDPSLCTSSSTEPTRVTQVDGQQPIAHYVYSYQAK
ncbi:protein suppressor of variegation 3-7 [Stomoxys calcitrans]|uniref:BESS domain-containing protein n=1 Tax=Stomoxys calcitrans TaxID=35570 RepID=A0A1I8PG73_STOCA|nr:protein suppressor of variegation 3-7 [Stomoxys calcitrans]